MPPQQGRNPPTHRLRKDLGQLVDQDSSGQTPLLTCPLNTLDRRGGSEAPGAASIRRLHSFIRVFEALSLPSLPAPQLVVALLRLACPPVDTFAGEPPDVNVDGREEHGE